jgi:DNA-binding transcriptional regulator YdaS (Cro superfamily)
MRLIELEAAMSPIEKAVSLVGGQANLAKAIGVSASFVNQWVTGVRPVPPTRCRSVEEATGGAVTRFDLRPDVFGDAAA